MIGSSTLIVKEHNTYGLHVCGGMVSVQIAMSLNFLKEKYPSLFAYWKECETKWREKAGFDAEVSPEQVEEIMHSFHCLKEGDSGNDHDIPSSGYSKYAGDAVYLLDYDVQKFFTREGERGQETWKEETFENLTERYAPRHLEPAV